MAGKFKVPSEPSPEVLRYFTEKKLKPTFDWREVWGQEHAHAFTVAKSTGFDILGDVNKSLESAIREGKTFKTFRDELEPLLRKKGWWGKKPLIDPETGELVKAQLGSPRRLKVIYEANVRTARAAGQWQRSQRTKAVMPNFEYRLGPSERHRPHHVALQGTILPVDDVFWHTHFPPNGWGCKCWLKQLTRSGTEKKGGISQRPEIKTYDYYNKRTGRTEKIPVGIDPGWQTNPGRSRAHGHMGRFFERLEDGGKENARSAMNEFWKSGAADTYVKTVDLDDKVARKRDRIQLPAGFSPIAKKIFNAKSDLISVSTDTLKTKIDDHGRHSPELFKVAEALPAMLDNLETFPVRGATEVWAIMETANRLWRIAMKKNARGFIHISSIHPNSRSQVVRHKNKK